MPAELNNAYAATDFIVQIDPEVHIRIGQSNSRADRLLESAGSNCAALISAWNPFSVQFAEYENSHRHASLMRVVQELGFATLAAEGRDTTDVWPAERSLFVLGCGPEQTDSLLVQFGQNAAVVVEPGRSALLRWHPSLST